MRCAQDPISATPNVPFEFLPLSKEELDDRMNSDLVRRTFASINTVFWKSYSYWLLEGERILQVFKEDIKEMQLQFGVANYGAAWEPLVDMFKSTAFSIGCAISIGTSTKAKWMFQFKVSSL